MAGINRAESIFRAFSESRKVQGVKCIFLSHQKKDKDVCKKIADYLLSKDIDVYFDEHDNDLKISRQENNPDGVVDCIKKGINASSHMLVVVSPNTVGSGWVPWEVGYGYDKSDLSVLTLKGISNADLPHYLKTTKVIRGAVSLDNYLTDIIGNLTLFVETITRIKNFSQQTHPLANYLDWTT